MESRPARWSFARFPRTEEGRKGFPPSSRRRRRRRRGGRARASAPTRCSLRFRGAPPPRLRATAKECARPALRGSRPTGARQGAAYSRCAINSREFYFTAAAAAAAEHAHTCTRACTERVRRNSPVRVASARVTERALDLRERHACQISSIARVTPTPVRSVDFSFFFSLFFLRGEIVREGVLAISLKISEMRSSPWFLTRND